MAEVGPKFLGKFNRHGSQGSATLRGRIVVDAAQSLGTKYKGRPDGSFGDAAIFSFARNKPVPTAGTHGAIVWDDDSMTDKILSASMNGKLSRNGGIVSYGVNATPFELQAAQIDIGLDHMGEWQGMVQV